MNTKVKILSAVIVFLVSVPLIALAWLGKFVGVSDADTISVAHEGKAERIRLYGIDGPEQRQPFSAAARMNLRLPADVTNAAA